MKPRTGWRGPLLALVGVQAAIGLLQHQVFFLQMAGFPSRLAQRHAQHMAWALLIEALLLSLAAIIAAAVTVRANAVSGDAVIAMLAFAMGVRNATIRRVAVPDPTTTVLTMTLTGLAADSQLFGGSGKGSVRRTTAVLAMLLGALAGALLLKTSLFLPLAVAAALAFIILLAYPPAARREEGAQDRP